MRRLSRACLYLAFLSYGPGRLFLANLCERWFVVICFSVFDTPWPCGSSTTVIFRYGLFPQVGIALKPFLPQLQTTFTKALQDSNRGVRLKAADALGKLISIHIKVDPLFTELLNGIRVMEDPGVR